MQLIRYDAACHALAEARAVDEVKDLRDRASALAAYSRLAKNKELELDAAEIRIRAERRLGELMGEQRVADGFSVGGRPKKTGFTKYPVSKPPTLADAGIDKRLANRARTLAAVAKDDFEQVLIEHRDEQKVVTARTFAKLENAAPQQNKLWAAWVASTEAERLAFLEAAGLQRAPQVAEGKVDQGVWAEFVAHREAIKKPLRRQSAQKNYEILAAMTPAQQRASVNATISNSWQGIFPPKDRNGNNQNSGRKLSSAERVAAANKTDPDPDVDSYI